jgi:hypothetical protein
MAHHAPTGHAAYGRITVQILAVESTGFQLRFIDKPTGILISQERTNEKNLKLARRYAADRAQKLLGECFYSNGGREKEPKPTTGAPWSRFLPAGYARAMGTPTISFLRTAYAHRPLLPARD